MAEARLRLDVLSTVYSTVDLSAWLGTADYLADVGDVRIERVGAKYDHAVWSKSIAKSSGTNLTAVADAGKFEAVQLCRLIAARSHVDKRLVITIDSIDGHETILHLRKSGLSLLAEESLTLDLDCWLGLLHIDEPEPLEPTYVVQVDTGHSGHSGGSTQLWSGEEADDLFVPLQAWCLEARESGSVPTSGRVTAETNSGLPRPYLLLTPARLSTLRDLGLEDVCLVMRRLA